MKKVLAVSLLAVGLFALGARADDISYSLSVQNAPGGIGNFSWTLDMPDFIQAPTYATYQNGVLVDPGNNGLYDSFTETSAPSNGDGCGITKIFAAPGLAITTYFSPLCDGLFDSETGGALPDEFGTWTWTGTNPDNTQSITTLTISDPPTATPEPSTILLLSLGLAVCFVARKNPWLPICRAGE